MKRLAGGLTLFQLPVLLPAIDALKLRYSMYCTPTCNFNLSANYPAHKSSFTANHHLLQTINYISQFFSANYQAEQNIMHSTPDSSIHGKQS